MKLLMGKGLTHTPEESEVAIGKSNYETRRTPALQRKSGPPVSEDILCFRKSQWEDGVFSLLDD
jgi:hypothetical protein